MIVARYNFHFHSNTRQCPNHIIGILFGWVQECHKSFQFKTAFVLLAISLISHHVFGGYGQHPISFRTQLLIYFYCFFSSLLLQFTCLKHFFRSSFANELNSVVHFNDDAHALSKKIKRDFIYLRCSTHIHFPM